MVEPSLQIRAYPGPSFSAPAELVKSVAVSLRTAQGEPGDMAAPRTRAATRTNTPAFLGVQKDTPLARLRSFSRRLYENLILDILDIADGKGAAE
jgi:hypothetical protein